MIEQAQALGRVRPRAEFVVADALNLPFPAKSFSAVLCTTALRHFTDANRAAAEMVRVLTPAGRVVVADFLEAEPRAGAHYGCEPGRRKPPPVRWLPCPGPVSALSS